ncbi:MAG: hypothetical protein AABX01_01635 [Candidatus Micrarchaeota archaeon]
MNEISYDALRKIQMQERNFGALSALDEDFYEKYNLWIMEQKRLLQVQFSIETLKAFENAKKIIEEVSAKREQKIVLKALKDLRASSVDSSGLSREEKSLYLKLLSMAKEFQESVVLFSEKKTEFKKSESLGSSAAATEKTVSERLSTIKILVSMGKFVAPDGATYGPFEPSQTVSIESGIAEILIRKGAAKKPDDFDGAPSVDAPDSEDGMKGGMPDTVIMN